MSKALLLIVCDFLLISLLALARFDTPLDEELQKEPETVSETISPEEDLSDVLKASLEEERLARERLNAELEQAQEELLKRQRELANRDQAIQETQAELTEQEREKLRLAAERAALERQLTASQANIEEMKQQYDATRENLEKVQRREAAARRDMAALEQKFESTRTNVTQLEEQLAKAQSENAVSQEVLNELQTDLRNQVAFSSQLQQQMVGLEKDRQAIQVEKQQLAGQLQVAQTETRLRVEQLETMQTEVAMVRTEKQRLEQQTTKLAEDVSDLAVSSEKLTQEIREARPLTANAIFLQLSTNRIETNFKADKAGLLGNTVEKPTSARSILVSLGDRVYSVYHVEATPFELNPFPPQWLQFRGTLGRGSALYSITRLYFLDRDPRIAIVPIGVPQANRLGARVYPIATDPSKFQEAVLVGVSEGYYGECSFQIDPATPNYVRMQRERFSFFSGKFVPSPGDLVLSKTGEVLGVMANKEYCLLLNELTAQRSIQTGPVSPGPMLIRMHEQLMKLPYRLQ